MTKTLLLIHGYPLDHTLWNDVISKMAPGVRILAPDLPGFGGAPVSPGEPSIDMLADVMDRLLSEQNIDRAVVAGMSMGGYVALSLAERHPARVAGLGIVSSHPFKDSGEARRLRMAMIRRIRGEGAEVAATSMIPRAFASISESRPELLAHIIQGAARSGVDGLCWALEAMANRRDLSGLLKRIDIPVHVIHGKEDKIIPVTRAREFARFARHGAITEIAAAGHMTPVENPTAVAEGLNDLIARSSA